MLVFVFLWRFTGGGIQTGPYMGANGPRRNPWSLQGNGDRSEGVRYSTGQLRHCTFSGRTQTIGAPFGLLLALNVLWTLGISNDSVGLQRATTYHPENRFREANGGNSSPTASYIVAAIFLARIFGRLGDRSCRILQLSMLLERAVSDSLLGQQDVKAMVRPVIWSWLPASEFCPSIFSTSN